jgi:glycerol-3-phosphate acyltransferase PlsY
MGGNGNGHTGVNRVMGTVGGGMTAMLDMLKDQFGIDIARMMAAKTAASTLEAETAAVAVEPAPRKK